MSEQTQNEAEAAATEETVTPESSASQEPNLELAEQVAALTAEVVELKERALRAQAEADNVRRRAERDVQSAHKFALEGFVEALLPIIDSLEQGLQQPAENDESKALKEGMDLTLKMFVDALAKKNVVQMDPQGEVFNPELHEAMSMQENSEFEPNTIIAVFQKGYSLNGRVVRPARVVVNKAKPANIDQKV
ncbi:MAG: nucleotide exchange factor GrpE [Gammaproteobacteria bacterium]|nr:nucleotide exchange factor GrpE [Gammaproteobacteria bacterium]NVK89223.1 nucleotide exchange factor GrpE [Gammaproteobacteria bacterium]